ncbi:MAG: hypothetical protein R2855_04905 [Thermomicrobiales bacterium]
MAPLAKVSNSEQSASSPVGFLIRSGMLVAYRSTRRDQRVGAHPNRFKDARLPKNRLHRTEVVAQDIGVVHPGIERDCAA